MKSQTITLFLALIIGFSAAQKSHFVADFTKYQDQAMQVQAKIGDDIHVKVPANPTTGYSWMVASNLQSFTGINTVSNNYVSPQQSNGVAAQGKGGVNVMRFGITSTGDKQIELVYAKSWEANKFADANGQINWTAFFNDGRFDYQRKSIIVSATN
ncbi:UNKNOWN [Stylonychia lemnae]|uniref:Proteinase inhibitor I42 chagasin domain-containing protein n=1 Tax=Stylonychia lemnae TaxID=5949 RepID=A0A078AXJ5_STYLE|nr:UNKNOWN [Stylonychia lemnae]|eukprot:CDW87185.1 UNKNOWN [Stylonychia lemnae]